MSRTAATAPPPRPATPGAPEGATAPTVTVGEAVVGVAVAVVAVVGQTSLALAHGRVWSLAALAVLSAAIVGALALWVVRTEGRPQVRVDARQLGVLGVVGVAGLALFLPGFPVGMAGWDPGVYVEHALAIPRTGAYDLADPVLAVDPTLPGAVDGDGVRFPGLDAETVEPGRSVPGFYHLYAALLAPAGDVAGEAGVVNVNPLLALLATWAATLVGWRCFGPLAGGLTGALLATNMMWVWHARLPSSEVLTALLVLAATLGIAVAVQERWHPAAALAGVVTGGVFLARADGMILVVLAVAGLSALAAAGRFDRRAGWYAVGLAVVAPHALAQAYHFADHYTRGQGLPGPTVLVGVVALLAGVGALAGAARTGRAGPATGALQRPLATVDRLVARGATPAGRRRLGTAATALLGLVLVYNVARPLLSDVVLAPGADPNAAHDHYDPRSLLRLSWFLTPEGIVAAWAGLAVMALRPWRLERWVAVTPALALLPLYLQQPRISARLMWWTRRFVPYTLAGLLLLAGVAFAAGLAWRGRHHRVVRGLTGAAAAVMVASQLAMSLPLRSHDELEGSLDIHHEVAALAPDGDALFLWVAGTGSAEAFASTLLYRTGAAVGRLPAEATANDVAEWLAAFPDRPAHLVADGTLLPPGMDDLDAEPVHRVREELPLWRLTYDERPDDATTMSFDFTVWRLPRDA